MGIALTVTIEGATWRGERTITFSFNESSVVGGSAADANVNTVKERTFENVPVTRNQITRYTGSFFGSGGSGTKTSGTFRLTADPDWDSVNGYTF